MYITECKGMTGYDEPEWTGNVCSLFKIQPWYLQEKLIQELIQELSQSQQ
jgi:hypothetical protein